jgi:hypothetical protein
VDFFARKIPRIRIFRAKNSTTSARFEPAILDTTRPPKPPICKLTELSSSLSTRQYHIYCFRKYSNCYFSCRTERCHFCLLKPIPFNTGMSNRGSPEGHMGHICVVMRATHDMLVLTFIRSRGLQSHKRSRGGYLPPVTFCSF